MNNPKSTISIDDVDREQRSKGLWPAFSPSIEKMFRGEAVFEQWKSVIVNWLIGLVLMDSFLISDVFVAGSDFYMYVIGRLFLLTPLSLLSIFFISKRNSYYQALICSIPFILSAVLSGLLILSHGTYRSSYLFGDILLMICGCVISRPLLSYAIATVVLQCFCYMAVLVFSTIIPPDSVIVSALFCLSGGIVTLMTVYAIEQAGRRTFLLSLRVRLLNQELEAMVRTDPLTGLGNRRAFEEATQRFWHEPSGKIPLASFILMDVDRFKLFNDSYGHAAGDLCLATLARCVIGEMRRPGDLAVRFGGEELIAFLPSTDFTEARQIAESIRVAIARAAVPHPAIAADAVVSASLGVATSLTTECTPADLVIRADMALYAAKRSGRNRVWPPLTVQQNTDVEDRPIAEGLAEAG